MSDVRLEVRSGCAVITLDAPERRNSITPDLARDLITICDTVDRDDAVGAAVIAGAGPTFCAGADRALLEEVGRDPSGEREFAGIKLVYESFARVGRLAVPTVVALTGAAVGAGSNLALAGDVLVVGSSASIRPGFLPIGAHPGGGHFHLLGRRAGRQQAAAVGLFGTSLVGPQIVAAGLALECVADDEAVDRAEELAAAPAADPPLARLAVATMHNELDGPGLSWPAAIQLEHAPQMWSLRRRVHGSAASSSDT